MNKKEWVQFVVKAYSAADIEASTTLQNELRSAVQEGSVTKKQKEVFQEAVVAVTTVFFRMATNGSLFGSLKRIRETFGFTLEQNYALTEGPFIKMARTYWTFKIEIEDLFEKESNLLIWQILNKVERNIGSLFFPMPGYSSVRKRVKTQKSQLEFFAPNMDINRFIYENPILDNESKRTLSSRLWRMAKRMQITFKHLDTGETRNLKVGWSWTLFFFSGIYGIPLFLRGLRSWGWLMFCVAMLQTINNFYSPNELNFRDYTLIIADVFSAIFFGFKGNDLTLKQWQKNGWVVADDQTRSQHDDLIHFRCPSCQTKYSAKIEQAGKEGKCKNCGAKMVVPNSNAEVSNPQDEKKRAM